MLVEKEAMPLLVSPTKMEENKEVCVCVCVLHLSWCVCVCVCVPLQRPTSSCSSSVEWWRPPFLSLPPPLLVPASITCTCTCKQLPSINVLISKYLTTRRVVVSVGGVNGSERQLKFDTCTLIGVHSTIHLVDPIKVHINDTVCTCTYKYFVNQK